MNYYFRKGITGTEMVVPVKKTEPADIHQIRMITSNCIPGLLPAGYEEMNGESRLVYDLGTKIPLMSSARIKTLDHNDISLILDSLKNSMKAVSDYLLETKWILLKPDLIFTEVESNDYFFCFYPFNEDWIKEDAGEFLMQLVKLTDAKDKYAMNMLINDLAVVRNSSNDINSLWDGREKLLIRPDDQEVFEKTFCEPPYIDEPPEHAADQKPGKDSFIRKLRMYLKGKKISDVVYDIDTGVIIERINNMSRTQRSSPDM